MCVVIIMATLLVEAIILFFALYRNDWVYRERTRLFYADYIAYKKLPSYHTMVWGDKFWIFDINIFT